MAESTELAEKLKSEGERIWQYFFALKEEDWAKEVYTEGTVWNVRNVLAHLVTSERRLLKLFENIRVGGEGTSPDFSIDRYNAAQQEKTKDFSPAELLEQYRQVRAETAAWVDGLSDDDLNARGRHPYLGETDLREMVKMFYAHNQLHQRDVKRALG
ncbi:MAG: DinB family protein [Anaerolineales bacterium]|nr:DinB family protein [Anaerolineales bacterium]